MRLGSGKACFIGSAGDGNVLKKPRQFIRAKGLGSVHQGFFWSGMKVHQHHIGAGDDALPSSPSFGAAWCSSVLMTEA